MHDLQTLTLDVTPDACVLDRKVRRINTLGQCAHIYCRLEEAYVVCNAGSQSE